MDVLELDLGMSVRKETEGESGADAALVQAQKEIFHLVQIAAVDGEDDIVDNVVLDNAVELVDGAKDRVARRKLRVAARSGAHHPEDTEAPEYVRAERVDDGLARGAGADNNDGSIVEASRAGVAGGQPQGDLFAEYEEAGENGEKEDP